MQPSAPLAKESLYLRSQRGVLKGRSSDIRMQQGFRRFAARYRTIVDEYFVFQLFLTRTLQLIVHAVTYRAVEVPYLELGFLVTK